MVEKSSTRRPAKLSVKLASSFAAIVIENSLSATRASSRGENLNCGALRGKYFPDEPFKTLAEARPYPHFNPEEKLESFLHQFRSARDYEGAF